MTGILLQFPDEHESYSIGISKKFSYSLSEKSSEQIRQSIAFRVAAINGTSLLVNSVH